MTLTTIDGIPLYSTLEEALQWASNHGLTGYHNHNYEGANGFMGGSSHSSARTAARTPRTTTRRSSRPSSSNY
tara:strand:+ start:177 stop:395 length:219 start_codon:yes stop_codon:yes gene_type:complete